MYSNRMCTRSLGLTATACLIFVGLASCSTEAEPQASPDATVEVDVYSGRQNPVVPLSADALDELQGLIEDNEREPATDDSSDDGLGFRGLVVMREAPNDGWTIARVVPDAVIVTKGTEVTRIADPDGTAFDLTWNDIRGELDPEVVTAVEQST